MVYLRLAVRMKHAMTSEPELDLDREDRVSAAGIASSGRIQYGERYTTLGTAMEYILRREYLGSRLLEMRIGRR